MNLFCFVDVLGGIIVFVVIKMDEPKTQHPKPFISLQKTSHSGKKNTFKEIWCAVRSDFSNQTIKYHNIHSMAAAISTCMFCIVAKPSFFALDHLSDDYSAMIE